jgi:hypothetical protein
MSSENPKLMEIITGALGIRPFNLERITLTVALRAKGSATDFVQDLMWNINMLQHERV